MGTCIYLNGKYVTKREEAVISVYDHGFLYGDGVFEGIRVYNGRIFRLKEHLERLYRSAAGLALVIPISIDKMEKLAMETCRRTGMKNLYIRLVVSRGVGDLGLDPRKCKVPSIIIMADEITLYPKEKYKRGLKMITTATRRNRLDCINGQMKSLNYLNNILAKIETFQSKADEGLMLTTEGYVCEATADNVFIIKSDGKVYTPPVYIGILEGITRNATIEVARQLGYEVIETRFTLTEVYASQECFLTGTGAELIPVIEVDSRPIGHGKPGRHFKKLLKGYRKLTQTEGVEIYK